MSPCPSESRWPFRISLMLAAVTFPLIWVGGLVTTYDAGMSVPDWPGTYGYNLLLYPVETWIAGPWDLFIEHGHRLLGVVAGTLNIALVVAVYLGDQRVWMRHFSVWALVAVTLQGCLGGFRVLLDDRQLAMIHGCAGPAFFGVCVALCVVTSRTWKAAGRPVARNRRMRASDSISDTISDATSRTSKTALQVGTLPVWTMAMLAASYVQLVLGAVMRHVPVTATPGFFAWTVYGHLIVAGIVLALAIAIAWLVIRGGKQLARWRSLANSLAILIVIQLLLGCATWVVNYYWPGWVPEWSWTARYPMIEAKGWLQTMVVTAHQAMGSLIGGVSVWLMLSVYRQAHFQWAFDPASEALAGGAAA